MDIRLLTPEETEEAIRLADGTFRGDGRPSLAVSSPKLFSPGLGQSIGGFAGGRLVSFAGLVPSVVRVGAARLQVYSYGAVCTHPDFRGKGIASAVLDYAKLHVRRADASLLLVSGTRSLYTSAGCFPFGTFRNYTLLPEHGPLLASRLSPEAGCRTTDAADWFRLRRLSAEKPAHYEQSLWDLADLLRAKGVASMRRMEQIALIAEQDGEATAFCVLALKREGDGSGARNGFVIEWAGGAGGFCSLLRHALETKLADRLDVTVSWHETEVAELLGDIGAESAEADNSGTVHIADAEKLFRQLQPYWEQRAGRGAVMPAVRLGAEGACEVTLDGCRPAVLNAKQLASLVFDKEPEGLPPDAEWRRRAASWFPIPFPYTKGLNYV
ncbi:GNAT family N-acetyltransferase [Paenibacillus sp. GYB003]|uniref:GNAT family N-acetyltransferase n=1 Tax=Paenibacillus sp. GYB003 TaxID=2994392 RepID=UPI002F962BD6